jgi:hypothetical protein
VGRRSPAVVKAEFEARLDAAAAGEGPRAKCDGDPESYQDYPGRDRPTRDEAFAACEGCPFFPDEKEGGPCHEYGVATKGWGLWGGVILQEGRRLPWAIMQDGKRVLPPTPKRASRTLSEKIAA